MTEACRKLNFHPELIRLVRCSECLNRDREAWAKTPDDYPLDVFDLHIMHSVTFCDLIKWFVIGSRSGTLKPAEVIVFFMLAHLIAITLRPNAPTEDIAISVLSQLKQLFDGTPGANAMEILSSEGLDLWVGVVAVLASDGYEDYEQQFWDIYLEALQNERCRFLETFEDLQEFLSRNFFWPSSLNAQAKVIWDETPPQWKACRTGPDTPPPDTPDHKRRRGQHAKVPPPLTVANPYMNAQVRAHLALQGMGSVYNDNSAGCD